MRRLVDLKQNSINIFFKDNHIRIFNKDCRSMDELPDESVQMVCTSPPYWGLRKYSGEQELVWDGDKDCNHEWESETRAGLTGGTNEKAIGGWAGGSTGQNTTFKTIVTNTCSLCGAWKGAYGLEPTPEMYVQHTIEMRNDHKAPKPKLANGQKAKDLCLIPFRVAIAAQEDGWWVRSVIIWSKPNPMPESVTDRPTESHEYILMLTKAARYYWDADAVREPQELSTLLRYGKNPQITPENKGQKSANRGSYKDFDNYATSGILPSGRNIRSVWEFPTQPYPEAHFAVFPEKLPELCIKAATPEVGCCSKCGAPWERITEKQTIDTRPGRDTGGGKSGTEDDPNQSLHQSDLSKYRQQISYETLGWQPTCKCNADKVPSLVLDPFLGAGTTLWVAKKFNRMAVGYELSEEYCKLAVDRCRQQVLI